MLGDKTNFQESEQVLISDRMLSRLHSYLNVLSVFAQAGRSVISSGALAEKVGVKSGLVRKDLSRFGGFGRPSVGYNVTYLQRKIGEILRIRSTNQIAWVGAKRLAGDRDLLRQLLDNNCSVAAVFGSDGELKQKMIGDLEILDCEMIEKTISESGIRSAVIAGGEGIDPQAAAEALIRGGVRAILNLTPTFLAVPPEISVRNIDILGEIMLLSYHCGETKKEQDNGSSQDA